MGYNPNEYVGSGLPTGFTGTIKNAAFTYAPQISDGQAVVLSFDMVTDDEELGVLADQILVMDNVRKDDATGDYGEPKWEAVDDGKKIRRIDGKKTVFNNASKAGRFLDALNSQDVFVAAVNERWSKGEEIDPLQAAFYEGLTGTWERVGKEFQLDNGSKVNSEVLCCVEFTGYAGAGAATPAKAGGKKAAPKAAAVVEEADTPDESAVRAKLQGVYDAAEDGDEFLMNAYAEIPEIGDFPAIQAGLDDGSLWDELNA